MSTRCPFYNDMCIMMSCEIWDAQNTMCSINSIRLYLHQILMKNETTIPIDDLFDVESDNEFDDPATEQYFKDLKKYDEGL